MTIETKQHRKSIAGIAIVVGHDNSSQFRSGTIGFGWSRVRDRHRAAD
jgi:hypothetical protein